ncbi:MAG: hypothetical protein KDM64_11015 [Verrucomicrobiae bacterium]|nr:hypothetical protein [Verrucomicrobiae bacterium]
MRRSFLPTVSALAAIVGGMAGIFLSSCESKSGFFRADNPFDVETRAIAGVFDPAVKAEIDAEKEKKRSRRQRRNDAREPTPQVANPYFGRAQGNRTLPEPRATEKKTEPAKRLFHKSPPAEPEAVATAPTSDPEPVPLERSNSGPVCYRCNGKGRILSSLSNDAEMITCEACHGTGRRPVP